MASRLNQNYTKFPISNDSTSNNTELTLRLKADLQIAEGAEIETAHINKLLIDTDPELLMPSKREQQRASGQKDDWAKVSLFFILFLTEKYRFESLDEKFA